MGKIAEVSFVIVLVFFNLECSVHIFGDSHALFSFCNPDKKNNGYWTVANNIRLYFFIHWLGPITMHRVGRDGLKFLNIKNYGVRDNDIVIFVFGEIDVRCHIGKQRDQQLRNENEIINTLVSNYFNTLILNKNLFKKIIFVVFNVPPPSNNAFNTQFPYYGSLEDRVHLTKLCNNILNIYCTKHNFHFLDVYNFYAQENGSLNPQLGDGNIHINVHQNQHVKDKLFVLLNNLLSS